MTDITSSPVRIGISPHAVPSTPSWFGEVAAFAQVLIHTGILKEIQGQVRFTRARFGKSRSHRFCCRFDRLCSFRRTHAVGVLRTARSVCIVVHGAFWPKPLASSLHPVPVSRCPRPTHGGSPADMLSRRCACTQVISLPRWPG